MKKIIITIFITLVFVIISGGYAFGVYFAMDQGGGPAFLVPLFSIAFISIAGVLIYNMYERIKEIKGGEENDISKY